MLRSPALAVLAAAALAVGCTRVRLTPQAERVRVTGNPEAVRGCARRGAVAGADHLNGTAKSPANAERFLKRDADRLGANTVLVTSTHTDASGSEVRGEAYACPT